MAAENNDRNSNSPQAGIRILRVQAVRAKTGLSISTIYELLAGGKFPQPIRLSTRCVGWVEAEVDIWLRQRLENRAERKPVLRRRRTASAAA